MPLTEIVVIGGICILEITLFFLFFYRRSFEIIRKNLSRRVIAFVGIQCTCVFFMLVGGYLEKEKKLYTHVRKPLDEYRDSIPESPKIAGDPALIQWVERQKPGQPRPDFTSIEELRSWQTSLRNKLYAIFNTPDIATPVDVQYHEITSTTVAQGITRTFLTFEAFDGTTIPAYLFIPPNTAPQPAIIVLHGHIGEYDEGITQTGGLVPSYHNSAALELAKAGFVTFTLEFRGFGYLGPYVNTHYVLVAYNAILGGSFYKAIISKDIKYAFDVLQSLPEVDPKRIGITGASLGGEMAVAYGALDERIKAVAFNSFGGSTGERQGVFGKTTEQPFYTHIIPGHNTYFLQEDLYFLIAPRPLLGVEGDRDYTGNAETFSKIVGNAYKTFAAGSRFRFEVVPGGHEYFVQPSVRFFKQHL